MKIFKTKAKAEEYLEFIKAKKEYSYEFTEKEWEDENINEYYYYYRHEDKKICPYWSITYSYGNKTYFKTEEDMNKFIEKYKKQILKYEFGIENV